MEFPLSEGEMIISLLLEREIRAEASSLVKFVLMSGFFIKNVLLILLQKEIISAGMEVRGASQGMEAGM